MTEAAFSPEDFETLRRSVETLERPGWLIRLANTVGFPLEKLASQMPKQISGAVHDATGAALRRALEIALYKLDGARSPHLDKLFKIAVGGTGAAGGFFGMGGLAVELPVSTTIMLRSIATIARDQGEDLSLPESRLACLTVFALGGGSSKDDSAETGYYAIRAALARTVSEAATFIAERGLAREGAPVLARLLAQIAARFGIVVSEKVAAEAIPVIGALGGASINVAFMDHFQKTARAHFAVRRLERVYGESAVQAAYARVKAELGTAQRTR